MTSLASAGGLERLVPAVPVEEMTVLSTQGRPASSRWRRRRGCCPHRDPTSNTSASTLWNMWDRERHNSLTFAGLPLPVASGADLFCIAVCGNIGGWVTDVR